MENNNSTQALVLISKMFNENKISETDRETLKEMIFNEDTTLLGFFEHYDDANDIENAILKYAKGGAIEACRPPGLSQPTNSDDVDQLSSPVDFALEMKKKKRLNQQHAAEREKQTEHAGGVIGVTDCDLGASPQLSKGPLIKSKGKYSPLQKAKEFTLGK